MWALACVILTIYAVLHAWIRSRRPWTEFFLLQLARFYGQFWHRWSANRPAPFPREGPAIVISNHTCSADPPLIVAGANRLLSFLVSNEHFHIHAIPLWILTQTHCIPVSRTGQDPAGLLRALRFLQRGGIVCVFPEGNLSGVALGQLRRGKPGMTLLALRSKAPVFPVYISGGPRTDRLLKSWLIPSPKAVRVIYGEPVDLSAYYDRKRTRRVIEEVTALLMKKIEELDPHRRTT